MIVTSATIDAQRFSEYFDGAPVVEVGGRTFPVEVEYRGHVEESEHQLSSVLEEIDETSRDRSRRTGIFLR